MLVFVVITLLVTFLLYVGFQVETGRRKPMPKDKFFPLFGRNIDYVLGTAGILVAIGIVFDGLGLSVGSNTLTIIGLILILAGIIRPYLNPSKFGPMWLHKSKL